MNQLTRKVIYGLLGVCLLALSACGGASDGGGDLAGDPADTVERYLQAKASADRAGIEALLCPALEGQLGREAGSFASVQTRVENLSCSREGTSDVVSCTGAIMATYGNEDTEFPFGRYQVVQVDGEWRWCGDAP